MAPDVTHESEAGSHTPSMIMPLAASHFVWTSGDTASRQTVDSFPPSPSNGTSQHIVVGVGAGVGVLPVGVGSGVGVREGAGVQVSAGVTVGASGGTQNSRM